MRILKIFLLHFEGLFEHRVRSFVWFLIPVANMLPMLLFWTIALKDGKADIDWSYQSLNTYYVFLIIAISMLSSHVEEDVGDIDIKQGELSKYLLKPFSYYWIKFFEEVPYRLLQGFYGVLLFLFLFIFLKSLFVFNLTASSVALGLLSAALAYFISFSFQLIVGYSAFWITESRLLSECLFIIKIIFAGQIVPLAIFPNFLKAIAHGLPFASMIYYPIVIFLGQVGPNESFQLIKGQVFWLIGLTILTNFFWRAGIKKFSAIGQ